MNILWIIVIGFVAGIVARFLAPGPNNPQGFILTTILGIVGAFLATFIGQAVGPGLLGPWSARWSCCSFGIGWCRAGLSKTPAPAAGCSPRRGIRGFSARSSGVARLSGASAVRPLRRAAHRFGR